MTPNIWNHDMKEPSNLLGKKPIIRKPAHNETLVIEALREISIHLTLLIADNYGCFDQKTDMCISFCRDLADETIRKIWREDE